MYSVTVKCGVDLSRLTGDDNSNLQHTEVSTTIPTLEDLVAQIQREIPSLTCDGAKRLAESAYEELLTVSNKTPFGRFAHCFKDATPQVQIKSWNTYVMMLDRMTYPADYGGGLHILPEIVIDGIGFHLVGITNLKKVTINYVGNGT